MFMLGMSLMDFFPSRIFGNVFFSRETEHFLSKLFSYFFRGDKISVAKHILGGEAEYFCMKKNLFAFLLEKLDLL